MTPAQLIALNADILANGDMNTIPNDANGHEAIATLYNALAAPTFTVWRSSIPTAEVFDAIVWASMTPNDAPDGTQTWLNRAVMCQAKQMNVQTMLIGALSINSSKSNIRAGLQDALTNVPSGAGGATVAAGWTAVRDAMKRSATRVEKLFATGGNGAFATPADLGFEGHLSSVDVYNARNT